MFGSPVLFFSLFQLRKLLGEAWPVFIQAALLIGSVAAFVYSLSLLVRRAHDVGYSTTRAIIWFVIPIANLILMFRLFFSPANAVSKESNDEQGVDLKGDIEYTSFDELSEQAHNRDNNS